MGRAPCCDKANVKRGPWSPEEDTALKNYVQRHGTGGNWIALPHKAGLKRCGKSCRLRWLNYLRPDIKHGGFTEEEDNIICTLYNNIGSRWSVIASQLPGRTDNDVKNYWNTKLKKKLLAGKTSLKSNNNDFHNNSITTDHNTNCFMSSTTSPTSLTKAETYKYDFLTSLNANSTSLPLPMGTQILGSDTIHFPLLGFTEMSEFSTNANNSYNSVSSSQEVSSLSGSSSLAFDNNLVSWPSNGGGGDQDDGFLMDFGFGPSYDLPNWFGLQEKTSEIAHILSPNLANSPYTTTLMANSSSSDIKPQEILYQNFRN